MEENKTYPGYSGKEKIIIGIFLAVVFLIIYALGFWVYKKIIPPSEKGKASIVSLVNEPVPEEEKQEVVSEQNNQEEEQPEENISPEEIDIKILNGGAPAGSAGKVKDALVAEDYEKAEAANAEGDYKGTIIYCKEGFKESAENIKEILKTDYPLVEIKEATSGEETAGDIVVILGE